MSERWKFVTRATQKQCISRSLQSEEGGFGWLSKGFCFVLLVLLLFVSGNC